MAAVAAAGANPPRLPPPTPAPLLSNQDLFQHSAWTVKVAGYQAPDSERMKKVDFSAFYDKFNKAR